MVINILDLIVYILSVALISGITRLFGDGAEGAIRWFFTIAIFTIIYTIIFVVYDYNISDINFGDHISW